MREEEITAIYGLTAFSKELGITIHKLIEDNKLQGIEIRTERITITLPIITDYKTIQRIIKKELIKYTHHKSLTPKYYHEKNIIPISKSLKSDKIVKQEPLLDLCY